MNIQNVNNAANPVQQNQPNPLQAANEQNRQQEQNNVQNRGNQEVNKKDNFTRTQAADRMQNLTNRRQELEQQIGALEQNQTANQAQPGQTQGTEIRQEINDINRELKNMAQPEADAATRRQREALTQYSEQNQNVIIAQTTTRKTMNLFGE